MKRIQNYTLCLIACWLFGCAASVEQDEPLASSQEALNQTTNFSVGVIGVEQANGKTYKTAMRSTLPLDQTAFGSSTSNWAEFSTNGEFTGIRLALSAFDRIPILGGVDFRFTIQARCYDSTGKVVDGTIEATPWASQLTRSSPPAASRVSACFPTDGTSPRAFRIGMDTRSWPGGSLNSFAIGAQASAWSCVDTVTSATLGPPVYTDWATNIASGSTYITNTAGLNGCSLRGERLLLVVF